MARAKAKPADGATAPEVADGPAVAVKFVACLAGAFHVWRPGDVADLSAAEAESLVAAGFAELADPTDPQ